MTTPHTYLQRNPDANTVTPVWIVQPKKEPEKEPYIGVVGGTTTWMR